MLKHITAALAAFFLLLPGSVFAESLDLSKLGDIEEAEQWEERAWYQREDGSDWRVQNDGSVIVTISATGDVTIGGDTRKSGKSIFDKQLAQEELGLDFPLSNVKSIFEADDMTLINFEGTLTNTKSATKNTYAGCALVIVSYHWGDEKDYVPNERQVPLGRATIDAGADLVIGHHSHRMNPIELYKGKYICYSLGNFSFAGNAKPKDMDTYIFQQRFRVYPDGTAENADMRIIPCSISSQEKVNDFKPTPKDADGAQALLARLDQLNAQFEKAFSKTGVSAVSPYPTEWKYAY